MGLHFKHIAIILLPIIIVITTVAAFRLLWEVMKPYLWWIIIAGISLILIYWIFGLYDPKRHSASLFKRYG